MGVFSRFMDIVNANINALLDKAEDPEKMIKLIMQEMEDTLIEMKSSCAAKMASRAKLDREKKDLEAQVSRWQSRAELAISKGRDDLAREALIEKKRASDEISRKLEEIANYDEIIKGSKEDITQLEEKLQTVKQKNQMITERAKRAREEKEAKEHIRKPSQNDAFERFTSFMEEKIDRFASEMEMDAWNEDLESRFRDLEELDEIEAELEALRKQAKEAR